MSTPDFSTLSNFPQIPLHLIRPVRLNDIHTQLHHIRALSDGDLKRQSGVLQHARRKFPAVAGDLHRSVLHIKQPVSRVFPVGRLSPLTLSQNQKPDACTADRYNPQAIPRLRTHNRRSCISRQSLSSVQCPVPEASA